MGGLTCRPQYCDGAALLGNRITPHLEPPLLLPLPVMGMKTEGQISIKVKMRLFDRAASARELFFFYGANNGWSRICINLIRKKAQVS